jgi:hypothetical protein
MGAFSDGLGRQNAALTNAAYTVTVGAAFCRPNLRIRSCLAANRSDEPATKTRLWHIRVTHAGFLPPVGESPPSVTWLP